MTQRGKIAHQPVDELGIGRILLAKLAELLLARAVDELPLQKQTLRGLIQRALGGTGRKVARTTELADLPIQARKRLNRARRRRVGSDGGVAMGTATDAVTIPAATAAALIALVAVREVFT